MLRSWQSNEMLRVAVESNKALRLHMITLQVNKRALSARPDLLLLKRDGQHLQLAVDEARSKLGKSATPPVRSHVLDVMFSCGTVASERRWKESTVEEAAALQRCR